MARSVYYPDDFETHKNLSHKQFPILVYYFMDGAVKCPFSLFDISSTSFSRRLSFSCWFSFWRRRIWLFWTYESSWLKFRIFWNFSKIWPDGYFLLFCYIYNGAVLIHCRHFSMTLQPKNNSNFRPYAILSGIWPFLTGHFWPLPVINGP